MTKDKGETMGYFKAGQYVISDHTGIEYLIVEVRPHEKVEYIGERSDEFRTPLSHSAVRLSTREAVSLRTEDPKPVPDDGKPVTLQPLGEGTYRVNGMNRSAITGRYKVGGLTSQEPHYKYEVGQKWLDGNIEIIGRARTTSGKNYYTVSRYGMQGSYEESRIAAFTKAANVPEATNNKRPAKSIGVLTKIRVEDKVWMVQNIALERNNELIAFGCALVSEGIDGAWDYKTHRVYTDAEVEVVE